MQEQGQQQDWIKTLLRPLTMPNLRGAGAVLTPKVFILMERTMKLEIIKYIFVIMRMIRSVLESIFPVSFIF